MTRKVIVVGAGFAGTASALSAAATGANVTVVDGGPGASELWTGAVDGSEGAIRRGHDDAATIAVLEALDLALGPAAVLVATDAGILRRAATSDRALLDLATVEGTVLVPNADVAGWDGAFLAGSLGAEAGEAEGRITFVTGPATLTRHEGEHGFPSAEMAALHDDGVRLGWLSDRLLECMKRHAPAARAVLLPPWLGARGERATVLSARLGVRVGEIVSGVPGSAGTRFRSKRDAAFERAGVTVVSGRVTAVAIDAKDAGPIRVVLEDGVRLGCDAVVLATGGVLGGGLRYFPSDATESGTVPKDARAPFEATIEAPVRVGWGGDAVPSPSSLFGTPPEDLFASRWEDTDAPADRVGVLTGPSGRANAVHGIFAVGDLVSDAERTVLDAVVSGVDAGRAAAAGHGFRS